ncbi:MAG: LamG domain-containing protein, partial [Planctomycetota bacterium]
TWQPGLDAKIHNVVFGDNFDDVQNAPAGSSVAGITFTPAALEAGKTYYWRVDEFNPPTVVTGEVWSFTTIPDIPIVDPNLVAWYKFEIGERDRIIDFSGHGNHGDIVGDVQWVPGQFNLGLEFLGDDMGHVDLPGGMVTSASGSIMMWVNTDLTGNEGMFWYGTETGGDGFGGENEVHIHNQDSGELGFHIEGATDVGLGGPMLAGAGWTHVAATWDLTDGCRLYANGVEVDFQAHNSTVADLSTIRLGRPVATGNGNRYHDGLLDDVRLFDHAITADQVNEIMTKGEDPARAGGPSPRNGSVTAINVATPLTWSAGEGASQHDVYFGTDQAAVADADASDTTGVYVGRQNATSYTPDGITMGSGPFYWRIDEVANDGTIVAGGIWSFSVADYALVDDFESYNDIPAGEPGSNLVYIAWVDGFDNPNVNGSTMGYVTGASLESSNVHGGSKSVPFQYDNVTAGISEVVRTFTPAQDWTEHGVITLSLWFAGAGTNVPGQLYVKVNGVQVNYDGDMSNLTRGAWQVWNIDLTAIGTNVSSVRSLAIGIQGPGATGTLLLDDIRLYAQARVLVTPVQPDPAGLVAMYTFEGNANDSAGANHGTLNGGPTFSLGRIGQAINLDGLDDFVETGKTASELGINGANVRTVTAWVFTRGFNDGGIYEVGNQSNGQDFSLRTRTGTNEWRIQHWGFGAGFDADFTYNSENAWVHFAHVYDGTTFRVYGDGHLTVEVVKALDTADDPKTFRIGEWNDNHFDGMIDDLRVYNRVLSDAELAGLAGITLPFDKPF